MKKNKSTLLLGALVSAALLSACQEEGAAEAGPDVQEPKIIEPAPGRSAEAGTTAFETAFTTADERLVGIEKNSPCALDTINGAPSASQVKAPTDSPLTVVGWISTSTKQVPEEFQIVLSNVANVYAATARAGHVRSDVANALQAESLRNSGFTVVANLEGVPSGEYSVSLVHSEEGVDVSCVDRPVLVVD